MSRWQWFQLLGFQGFWWVAVLGENSGISLLIALLALYFIASPTRLTDLKVLPLALLGWALDGLLTLMGVFSFTSWPLWLGLLWLGFVLTLGHSLRWLRSWPRYAQAAVGAVAGTASYVAGWRLGAVNLPLGLVMSVLPLALSWGALLPWLILWDQRIRKEPT